jgi:ribonucleoside-diphosphate reductase alpha chain
MTAKLTANAKIVLEKRYLRKNPNGSVCETPEALFRRVADAVARADLLFDAQSDVARSAQEFLDLMSGLYFLPNSPTLMNAGRRLGQLAACFVLPIEDSMESIFETLKHAAIIHKSGGGTGFSFSRIRPARDTVMSTAGVSSGPLTFMHVFDVATETIKQGGTRRGANMGVLRVDHPDIEAFIRAKDDPERLNNFNLSVVVTDCFMQALSRDAEYDLVNPRTAKSVRMVPARNIFEMLVASAWKSGEPGVVFIDAINRDNPTPQLGEIEATNPCGEQPLLPNESCTLGSINLARMITGGKLSWKRLHRTVNAAVHFLDNVVEINRYPLAQIENRSKQTRKIGLGVMGFADMLIKLGVAYDSEEAVAHAAKVMGFIQDTSKQASAALGRSRGNFPCYAGSRYDNPDTPHMRNATTTTIAPTGTISLIAGCSSGVEPLFAVAHVRRVLDGRELPEIHPEFVRQLKREGAYSKKLAEEVAASGSVQKISQVPKHLRRIFKTAHDIDPIWHVRIQATFQQYTDNAVSKTVNFPANATAEDVKQVYLSAYANGCKGVTIYRYGSRENQVLTVGTAGDESVKITPRPRPARTTGFTERISTGCGRLYVTINADESGMCEVFAQMGKTGGCASSQIEATGRLISLALRSGVTPEAIIKQLRGIRCPSPSWQNGKMVLSCPDAISQILLNSLNAPLAEQGGMLGICPDCSGVLYHEEGCLVCHLCGYSKCA